MGMASKIKPKINLKNILIFFKKGVDK